VGWESSQVLWNGLTAKRTWNGSTELTLGLGTYKVQTYSVTLSNGQRGITAYADNVGAVAMLLLSSDNKPILQCSLTRIVLADK
jgi:hypothetical protein